MCATAGDARASRPRPHKSRNIGSILERPLAAELHPDRFAVERQHMVEAQLRRRGIRDQRLLSAMASIPRHEFVEARYRGQAYEDHPLPIDAGQTISQPYIVALMLELLSWTPHRKCWRSELARDIRPRC